MKVRTIESQTTRPCCTQPQPADFQHSWRDHFWPNFKHTMLVFAIMFSGYLFFVGLVALYAIVRGG
ncbi:TPA: hypothetical protein ACLEK2_002852 [Acinetobacter baumannii]|nr:hypothetical protein [Acinetobacter baumannii]EKV2582575.1 hypothetical protein [Acinetobacter baumannii]EKV2592561.1 hypothetical protein [Acinetobacter baumannii]EKV6445728.1 hypothetical protein [Acinetobacter baumannii]HCW5678799.1 hypothetical protein [Acinetobacter baumannii]